MSAHGNGNGRGAYDRGESVKLDRELMAKYRKLQARTKIPLCAMIEHAMEKSLGKYEAIAEMMDASPADD